MLAACVLSVALSACQGTSQRPDPDIDAINNTTPDTSTTANELAVPDSPLAEASRTPLPKAGKLAGTFRHPALAEISGLAASQRNGNVLWLVNDSGNAAILHAVARNGEYLGGWPVSVANRDWEALESIWLNGDAYLLVGETGDNLRIKDEHAIYLFSEPDITSEPFELQPVHTIRFRYEDGKRNSEAMAVHEGYIYLLSKEPLGDSGPVSSRAYRVPLHTGNDNRLLVAEFTGLVTSPARSLEARLIAGVAGVDIAQPTAFDFTPDADAAMVLTYRQVLRYRRAPSQTWREAFASDPSVVHRHSLHQAEALGCAQDGSAWFTSEKTGAPLWALPCSHTKGRSPGVDP